MLKELEFIPSKKAYEMIEFACECVTFKDKIELELLEIENALVIEYQFSNLDDKVLLSNIIYKAQEQFEDENSELGYKQFRKNYLEYLNYIDPIIGYDEECEIHYFDIYGIPKYQMSYEEYINTIG